MKRYLLEGIVIATDWYDQTGYALVQIETDEEKLLDIKEEPLQDYLSYGVRCVDYVDFRVYEKKYVSVDGYSGWLISDKPIEEIEAGKIPTGFEFPEVPIEPVKIDY